MSVQAMNWVWLHSRAVGNSRLVLLAIADRCHEDGSGAWPALEDLQKKTLLSESTVRRCIQTLVDSGELQLTLRKGRTNTYRIRYESRHEQARTAQHVEGCQVDTPTALTPRATVTPRQFDTRSNSERGGVSAHERGGVSAVTPEPSSTPSTSVHRAMQPERRTADGQRVREFIAWWCDAYKAARRATYRVFAKKDISLARQLLALYGDDGLREMARLLFAEQSDPFIIKSDRGIGILSVKASWLDSKRAQATAAVTERPVEGCSHEPRCTSALACQNRRVYPERYAGTAV